MNAFRTPTRALGERNDNAQAPRHHKTHKRKEKPSAMCKTPPSMIQNFNRGQSYQRGNCIGEGGFARCFQVNSGDGSIYAAKTIAKATLSSEKTKTKLLAEIKIHRAMQHTNIVQFVDCFEDDVNVYILLEMCSNQSLLDMVRSRGVLTEIEARFFMVQLLGAVSYMHSRLVIHRDLKLGNVFIDNGMNLKIGDFGLAARLEQKRQRRNTICGTPNYIAPELLVGNHEHTFSVDIWALGIILYAMLFTKPPFQEKDVNVIYERIKKNDLHFPHEYSASPEAIDLIRHMLAHNPQHRPSVSDILEHPWFSYDFPPSIPSTALEYAPNFNLTPTESQLNFVTVKIASGLVMRQPNQPSIEPVTKADVSDEKKVLPESLSPPSTRNKYRMVIVNNGSSGSSGSGGGSEAFDSPIVNRARRHSARPLSRVQQPQDRDRENQWQQAVPAIRTSTTQDRQQSQQPQPTRRHRPLSAIVSSVNNAAASAAASLAMRSSNEEAHAANLKRGSSLRHSARAKVNSLLGSSGTQSSATSSSGHSSHYTSFRRDVAGPIRYSIHHMHQNLVNAIESFNFGVIRHYSRERVNKPIYLTKWADFNEMWGLAYGLNDGAIGMKFRDSTSMRYDPLHSSFMYFSPSNSEPGTVTVTRINPNNTSPERHKKVEALLFSHKYMEERLGHGSAAHRGSYDSCDGVFVERFEREQHYIMFVLSGGTIQFNFHDHNKIILFNNGENVHMITSTRQEYTLGLTELLMEANKFSEVQLTKKLEEIVSALARLGA